MVLMRRRWGQGGGGGRWPTGPLEVLYSAGDGGNQARSPGRARRKPLKPLRAGTPGVPVYLRSILVCFLPFAHEAMGAAGTRCAPRPLIFLGGFVVKPRAHGAAGMRTRIWNCCLRIESR